MEIEIEGSVPEWEMQLEEIKRLLKRRTKVDGRRSRRDHAPCRQRRRIDELSEKDFEIYLDQKLHMLQQFYVTEKPGKPDEEGNTEPETAKPEIDEAGKEDKENADCVSSPRLAIAPEQNGNKKMEKNLRNLKLQIPDVVESLKQVDDELETEQQMIKKGASQRSDDNNKINEITAATVVGNLHALPPKPPEPPDRGLLTAEVWPSYKLGEAFLSLVTGEGYGEEEEKMVGNDWEGREEDFTFDKEPLLPLEFLSSSPSSDLPPLPGSSQPPICGAAIDELRPSRGLVFLSHEVEAQLQVSNPDHVYIKGVLKVISRRERKMMGSDGTLNQMDHTSNLMGEAQTPIITSGQNIYTSHQNPDKFQIELPALEKFTLYNIPNIISIFPENYYATYSSLQQFVMKNVGLSINNWMIDFGVTHLDCSSKMYGGKTSIATEEKLVSVIIENGFKIGGILEAVGLQMRGVSSTIVLDVACWFSQLYSWPLSLAYSFGGDNLKGYNAMNVRAIILYILEAIIVEHMEAMVPEMIMDAIIRVICTQSKSDGHDSSFDGHLSRVVKLIEVLVGVGWRCGSGLIQLINILIMVNSPSVHEWDPDGFKQSESIQESVIWAMEDHRNQTQQGKFTLVLELVNNGVFPNFISRPRRCNHSRWNHETSLLITRKGHFSAATILCFWVRNNTQNRAYNPGGICYVSCITQSSSSKIWDLGRSALVLKFKGRLHLVLTVGIKGTSILCFVAKNGKGNGRLHLGGCSILCIAWFSCLQQWDPGGNYCASYITWSLCFQLWDPARRSLSLLLARYLHLEDKVNFKGGGVDTDISNERAKG